MPQSPSPRFSALDDWLSWQESQHSKEIDLGLDRIREVGLRLGVLNPRSGQSLAKVITVAGTNGKGSCVAALEVLLQGAGKSVGAYTSPHLLQYNERVRINGEMVSDTQLCEAFNAIDQARGDISLSYFEFGTLAALYTFYHAQLDFWLLEVGLGGRLDGVNIVDPDIAIITSIAIDHVSWLGDNREDIGREKAGICRAGVPLICADAEVPRSIKAVTEELACPSFWLGREFNVGELGSAGVEFTWKSGIEPGHARRLECLRAHLALPLPSLAAALQAVELLGCLPVLEDISALVKQINLNGRFQRIDDGSCVWILDVAHNPAAIAYLNQRVISEFSDSDIYLVAGMLADKDVEANFQAVKLPVKHWYLCDLANTPRALDAEELQRSLLCLGYNKAKLSLCSSVGQAIDALRAKSNGKCESDKHNKVILVIGSFFTVSAGMEKFQSLGLLAEPGRKVTN